jgi:hypothetical protein
MATITTPTPVGDETPSSEGTRRGDTARRRFTTRGALTWAAISAGLAAAVTLALVALLGGSDAGRVTGDHTVSSRTEASGPTRGRSRTRSALRLWVTTPV